MERIRMSRRCWQLAAAGVVAIGVMAPATAAFAAQYPDGGVSSETAVKDPGTASGTEVLGKTQVRGDLPFTGGDVAALAAIGGGAVAIGGVLVSQSRRRRVVEAG